MPDISVDIVCSGCGEGLDCSLSYNGWGTKVEVGPCPHCTKEAFEEGKSDGYFDGRNDCLEV